jgi:hypothetical protein
MIDKLLISVMAGALTVILFMQLMLCALPFFCRMEFDAICHQYALRMDRAGGMDNKLRLEMIEELQRQGFLIERIEASTSAPYGGDLNLMVKADFPFYRIGSQLTLEEVSISVTYQTNMICRLLKVVAAARWPLWLSLCFVRL